MVSNSNRSVVERDSVEVQKIDFQTFRNPARKTINCDVKPVTTNICGSDLHAVRGRTTAPAGIAGAAAVFLLSPVIADHGLWNRPYVESACAHAGCRPLKLSRGGRGYRRLREAWALSGLAQIAAVHSYRRFRASAG
jgi:hypothetical protein